MKDCIFCKIAQKEIPKEIVYEDDLVVAFPDINPIAPVHILVIPKEHIESINDLTDDEKGEKIAGHLLIVAKKIAQSEKIDKKGYKLLFRVGTHGGQEVPHIHLHLLGGARLSEGIGPIG
jgi:histidine triad (HIT) family protein